MTLTILFGISMAYLIFCAIMCAIRASTQGDNAYSIMLFSILVTYGSQYNLALSTRDYTYCYVSISIFEYTVL